MESCTLTDTEYRRWFDRKATGSRVPLSGSLELTRRCNLRCIHCYVEDRAGGAPVFPGELPTVRWLALVDEIAAAGCLHLLLTGGEPALHPYFEAIYSRIRTRGLLPVVFTNGTAMGDRILDLFQDLPPRAVEVSLYGATAPVYEAVTGVPGSFARCRGGIERLLARGIPVRVKTVVLTVNEPEVESMRAMAMAWGVRFRLDAAIFPRFDGGRAPLALRVPPDRAVGLEFADPEMGRRWEEFYGRYRDVPGSDSLYPCGAGRTLFHVTAGGSLTPCLMARTPAADLAREDFETGWRKLDPAGRERKKPAGFACGECNLNALCGYCPAFFELENGAEDRQSEYLCGIGRERHRRIQPGVERGI